MERKMENMMKRKSNKSCKTKICRFSISLMKNAVVLFIVLMFYDKLFTSVLVFCLGNKIHPQYHLVVLGTDRCPIPIQERTTPRKTERQQVTHFEATKHSLQ